MRGLTLSEIYTIFKQEYFARSVRKKCWQCPHVCQFPSMDLYTFTITSEPKVRLLQLRSQNLSLSNLKVPSGNSMGSKYCAFTIKSILIFVILRHIFAHSQISFFYFALSARTKRCKNKQYVVALVPSKFDFFRQ